MQIGEESISILRKVGRVGRKGRLEIARDGKGLVRVGEEVKIEPTVEMMVVMQIRRLIAMSQCNTARSAALRLAAAGDAEPDRHCRSHNIAAECCVWSGSTAKAAGRGVAGSSVSCVMGESNESTVERSESGLVCVDAVMAGSWVMSGSLLVWKASRGLAWRVEFIEGLSGSRLALLVSGNMLR